MVDEKKTTVDEEEEYDDEYDDDEYDDDDPNNLVDTDPTTSAGYTLEPNRIQQPKINPNIIVKTLEERNEPPNVVPAVVPTTPTIPKPPEPAPPIEPSVIDKRAGLENTPSIFDVKPSVQEKIEKTEAQKKLEEIEAQRKADEKKILEVMTKEDEFEDKEDETIPTTLNEDEIEDSVRYWIDELHPSSFRDLKNIARKVGVDVRKVSAIKHSYDEEKRNELKKKEQQLHEERMRIEREPPQVLSQPVVPGAGPINLSDNGNVMSVFMTYLLDQNKRADERAYQDRRDYESKMQAQQLQMMELMKSKSSGGLLDGEIGKMIISRAVSNVLNPSPVGQADSAIGQAVKTLVESGQFGNIVGGLIELGQAAVSKGNYDLSIPQDGGAQMQQVPAQQQPITAQTWTPEKFVSLIKQKNPQVHEDVALVAAQLVCSDPATMSLSPTEKWQYIIQIIQASEQLKSAAAYFHTFLIKQKKSPREAAEYVVKTLPADMVSKLKDYDYDTAIRELGRFEKCPSFKDYVTFFRHPQVIPLVKQFFVELKNIVNNPVKISATPNLDLPPELSM